MRNAVAGEVVETGKLLFTIANTKQMWLLLNVRLEEAERITLGQKIVFHPDGSQREATGSVTWISTEVDSETRTVRVRGELANANGRLRNETFGGGEIVLREEDNAIIVPSDAIHWEGCCHVAFVRDKDYFKEGSYKVFHTRSVRPGVKMGKNTEVIAGLLPGEVIVTAGSGILRAELLKGNLGAG
jgi:cobalt-zinc-cadmium efflux system membrane fusion protein